MEEVEPGKQTGPAEEESTEVGPRLERSNGSEPYRTGSGGGDRRDFSGSLSPATKKAIRESSIKCT